MEQEPERDAASQAGHGVSIDEGFRKWYGACPCCLGDAYPEVKQALDREHHAAERAEG